MITIKNRQKKIPINTQKLELKIQKILHHLGYDDYDIGLLITTNKTIRNLNKEYRHKDKATSILSFSFHPELKAGHKIKAASEDEKNLGDIIISAQYLKDDAPTWNQSFEQRLHAIVVHGICHLLGYTHDDDKEYAKMQKIEAELLSVN